MNSADFCPGRAGRDHDRIDAVVGDVVLDQLHALGAAERIMELVVLDLLCGAGDLLDVHRLLDAASLTDIYAVFLLHPYFLLKLWMLFMTTPVASCADRATSTGVLSVPVA